MERSIWKWKEGKEENRKCGKRHRANKHTKTKMYVKVKKYKQTEINLGMSTDP